MRTSSSTPTTRPVTCSASASAHPQLLSDALQKLVGRSGLPPIRFHDLRHTHATLLIKAGVPVKVVSERLGHSIPVSGRLRRRTRCVVVVEEPAWSDLDVEQPPDSGGPEDALRGRGRCGQRR